MINYYKKYSLTLKSVGNGGKWSVAVRKGCKIGSAKVKTETATGEN